MYLQKAKISSAGTVSAPLEGTLPAGHGVSWLRAVAAAVMAFLCQAHATSASDHVHFVHLSIVVLHTWVSCVPLS